MNFQKLDQIFDQLDVEQLRRVNRMVLDQLDTRVRRAALTFRADDEAEFVSTKQRRRVRIKIIKINQKTVKGTEVALNAHSKPGLTWTCAASLLERVTKESQAEGAGTW